MHPLKLTYTYSLAPLCVFRQEPLHIKRGGYRGLPYPQSVFRDPFRRNGSLQSAFLRTFKRQRYQPVCIRGSVDIIYVPLKRDQVKGGCGDPQRLKKEGVPAVMHSYSCEVCNTNATGDDAMRSHA